MNDEGRRISYFRMQFSFSTSTEICHWIFTKFFIIPFICFLINVFFLMMYNEILFSGGWGSTSSNQLYILDGAALPKIVRVSCKTLHTPRFKYGFSATLLSMPDVSPITQVSDVAWFSFLFFYYLLFYLILFDMILCASWCKLYNDKSVLIDLFCLCRLILEIVSFLVENPTLPLPLLHYPPLPLPVISLH